MAEEMQVMDPRVKRIEQGVKVAGVAAVALGAALAVAIIGATVTTAAIVAGIALVAVNVLPVVARRMALWKQGKLTQLAEEFSAETIREDEKREAGRVSEAELAYRTTEAEINGAVDELQQQLEGANEGERAIIENQVVALRTVLADQLEDLRRRQEDLKELRKVNGLLIAMDKAGRAIANAQQSERDPQQRQNLVTARQAIKTRMRAAIAGQRVDNLRREVHGDISTPRTAQLTHEPSRSIPTNVNVKEKEATRVSNSR